MKLQVPNDVVNQAVGSLWYKETKENPCSQGTHVVKVVGVVVDEEYGSIQLLLFTESGEKIIDRYNLYDKQGNSNGNVWKRFGVAYNRLMDKWLKSEFDTTELVGKIMQIEITHAPNPQGGVYVNTGTMTKCDSFNPKEGVVVPELIVPPKKEDQVDFSDIL